MSIDLSTMTTKIFADGADLESLLRLAQQPHIRGFTTNPTLMRKAGVSDYASFARSVLERITDRPISFEVFSDDADGMRSQAREIASWGPNVYVKIPVTNTRGAPMTDLVRELSAVGRAGERDRADDRAAGRADRRGPARRRAEQHLGVRRAGRRHRARPGADDDRGPGGDGRRPPRRADLGQPARGAEHHPGGPRSGATSSR